MSVRKTVLITPAYTVLDATRVARTPSDLWSGGVDALVTRVKTLFRGEGVILLDQAAARALGVSKSWTTYNGDPRVYLGLLSDLADTPLCEASSDRITTARFTLFADLVGVAYHRSPGVAGLNLLQNLHPKGSTKPVVWDSPQPDDAHEVAYSPGRFRRPTQHTFIHGYDRRRAGLAAMNTVQVARYALRFKPGQRVFDPALAGWWLCEIPPWVDDRMPDPAGYSGVGRVRWLTNPTISLINWLAELGISAGIQHIHGAYVAPKSRLFLSWAERVERAYQTADGLMSTPVDASRWPGITQKDAEQVRDTIKGVYRETGGMFTGADSWVRRHDWYSAIVAMIRATMWRSAYKVGQATGRWPVTVDGDKWWYGADQEDGAEAAPVWEEAGKSRGMILGDKLGQWRYNGTREVNTK